uniref:Uncharacterized protein n=1 Tax=Sphaerodactylus townsendi TaxID=933632 RepID=A0ACB8EST3_9SAUR
MADSSISFCATWTPNPGPVQLLKILWLDLFYTLPKHEASRVLRRCRQQMTGPSTPSCQQLQCRLPSQFLIGFKVCLITFARSSEFCKFPQPQSTLPPQP